MTYQQTLDWMFAQLPMYQQKGKTAFTGKMDNILAFTAHLDHPENKFKSIHVAGTNGKGSSSHMLASILQEAGYKVGLYTSPHLKDFRERIKIDGQPVSETYVTDFIGEHHTFIQEHHLSFFEMTVGMAYDYFVKEAVDIAVIEVGLGGRLDSTNIITPEVSLITNIGMDHTDILGDTLEQIAGEKAGIIKKGVPVVISERQPETEAVFKKVAKALEAPITFADELPDPQLTSDLIGPYQVKNIRGAVAAIGKLVHFPVSHENMVNGLSRVVHNTGLLGRWQQLGSNPKVICDTGHNKEGLLLVTEQLRKEQYKNLHMVLGFVKGKDLMQIMPLFPKNAQYYFCSPNISRGLEAEVLMDKAREASLEGKFYGSVNEAYKAALNMADPEDLVFVGGSTFVVAEIL